MDRRIGPYFKIWFQGSRRVESRRSEQKQVIFCQSGDLKRESRRSSGQNRRSLCQSRRSRAKTDDLEAESGRSYLDFLKCESRRSWVMKADEPLNPHGDSSGLIVTYGDSSWPMVIHHDSGWPFMTDCDWWWLIMTNWDLWWFITTYYDSWWLQNLEGWKKTDPHPNTSFTLTLIAPWVSLCPNLHSNRNSICYQS